MNKIVVFFISLIFSCTYGFSQCRNFTLEKVVPKLNDYLLTGKYHSLQMAEGEEIMIFKTLSKGLAYRFVIMSDKNIPQPHFTILDWNNNVIFDNEKNNYTTSFNYKCKTTERIKIIIKVPKSTQSNIQPKEGCVSLVIGIKS
jgi:hypothetical protein